MSRRVLIMAGASRPKAQLPATTAASCCEVARLAAAALVAALLAAIPITEGRREPRLDPPLLLARLVLPDLVAPPLPLASPPPAPARIIAPALSFRSGCRRTVRSVRGITSTVSPEMMSRGRWSRSKRTLQRLNARSCAERAVPEMSQKCQCKHTVAPNL